MFTVAQAELIWAQQVDSRSFLLNPPFRHDVDKINNFYISVISQSFLKVAVKLTEL